MDFQSITYPEDLGADMELMGKMLNGQMDNAEFEKRYVKKDGSLLYGLVSAQIIRDAEEENQFFVAQIVDITNRKEEEQQMVESKKRLEQEVKARTLELQEANKDMEHFLYTISHDLRVPLKNIGQLAGMVKEELQELKVEEEPLHALDLIGKDARKMNGLLIDLLEFSRSRLKEVKKTPFDMKALVEEVMEELLRGFEEKNIRLTVGNLTDAPGDKAALYQVWQNLLSNALKYSSREEEIRIDIKGEYQEGVVVYSVSDNGVGFEEQYKDHLFTLFRQLHAYEEFKGSGVGLAICQRIIKKHGGAIWADGKPGEGATFYFSLPKE